MEFDEIMQFFKIESNPNLCKIALMPPSCGGGQQFKELNSEGVKLSYAVLEGFFNCSFLSIWEIYSWLTEYFHLGDLIKRPDPDHPLPPMEYKASLDALLGACMRLNGHEVASKVVQKLYLLTLEQDILEIDYNTALDTYLRRMEKEGSTDNLESVSLDLKRFRYHPPFILAETQKYRGIIFTIESAPCPRKKLALTDLSRQTYLRVLKIDIDSPVTKNSEVKTVHKMSKDQVQDLDRKWRAIINDLPVSDNMNEFLLIKFLVQHQPLFPELNAYPFVYAWEYPIDPKETNQGKIDLILWDGKDHALIVEAKYISDKPGKTARTKRTNDRGVVADQAKKYATYLKDARAGWTVESWPVTNEEFGKRSETCEIYKAFIKTQWEGVQTLYSFEKTFPHSPNKEDIVLSEQSPTQSNGTLVDAPVTSFPGLKQTVALPVKQSLSDRQVVFRKPEINGEAQTGKNVSLPPDKSIIDWAEKEAKKNPYGLLLDLSGLIPEIQGSAWTASTTLGELKLLTIEIAGINKKFFEVGFGTTPSQAKKAAATKILNASLLLDWLKQHYGTATFGDLKDKVKKP